MSLRILSKHNWETDMSNTDRDLNFSKDLLASLFLLFITHDSIVSACLSMRVIWTSRKPGRFSHEEHRRHPTILIISSTAFTTHCWKCKWQIWTCLSWWQTKSCIRVRAMIWHHWIRDHTSACTVQFFCWTNKKGLINRCMICCWRRSLKKKADRMSI